jgi:hypothetical protein
MLFTVVLAGANDYAFDALKQVMASFRQGGMPSISDACTNEPRILVNMVLACETASDVYGYLQGHLGLSRQAISQYNGT